MSTGSADLSSRFAWSQFWSGVTASATVQRAAKISAIVGTLLITINQGDAILQGHFPPLWKVILTYCVPYSVSSYSTAMFMLEHGAMAKSGTDLNASS